MFFNSEKYRYPRAWRRASSARRQSPAVADRAADRTRAPRLVTRPLTRSGPSSALVEAPFEPAKRSHSDASRFSPRANTDASHGRAVLRVARRARRGRVRTVALVPANRVALNVRKRPVAALNARPETRWTDPPPFPEVRSARAHDRSSVCVAGTQPPNVRLSAHNKKTFLPACLYSHRNAFFAETRTSGSKRAAVRSSSSR